MNLPPMITMDSFMCPEKWIGKEVHVELSLPSQGPDGTLAFPGMSGVLLAQGPGEIVVRVKGKTAGWGEQVIPKSRIQRITYFSGIV